MLQTGQHIQERFIVEELVGEGGLAEVYRVRHMQLGSVHALKLLLFRKQSLADRLLLEGRIQAQLRHPNVVAVTDVVIHDGQYGLLMEYVENLTLENLIDELGAMPVDLALEYITQVLAGVDAAHKAGVLHRDLKPANVLLARVRGGLVPKVTDFGIAKVLDESMESGTRENVAMGTPGYMAPEQVLDARSVDARTDVFALAGMLYELVSGLRAFEDEHGEVTLRSTLEGTFHPLSELVQDVPLHVCKAIQAGLSRNRDERPESVEAFADLVLAEHPKLLDAFHGRAASVPIPIDPDLLPAARGAQAGRSISPAPLVSGASSDAGRGNGPTILPPGAGPSEHTFAGGAVAQDSVPPTTRPDTQPSQARRPTPPLFLTGAILAILLLTLGGFGGYAFARSMGWINPTPSTGPGVEATLEEPIPGSVRLTNDAVDKAAAESKDDSGDAVADPVPTDESPPTAVATAIGGGGSEVAPTTTSLGGQGTADDGASLDTDVDGASEGTTDTDAGETPTTEDDAPAAEVEVGEGSGTESDASGDASAAVATPEGGEETSNAGTAEPDVIAPRPARPMVMPMESFLASSWEGKVFRQPLTLRVLQERDGDVVAEGRIVLGAQQRILPLAGRYDPYSGAIYLKETNGSLLLQGTVSGSSIDGTYQREGRGSPSKLTLVRR